jgi:hypothetical protein
MVRVEKPLEPSGSGGFSLFPALQPLSLRLDRGRAPLALVLVLACVRRSRRRR